VLGFSTSDFHRLSATKPVCSETSKAERRSLLVGLIDHRYTTDGNQQSLWQRDRHGHPSRRIIRKEFGEKAVEFRKVGVIGDKNGGVYHQVEPATSSPQNGVEILERLPDLNIKGRASRFAS
jgi:hypothetical protein